MEEGKEGIYEVNRRGKGDKERTPMERRGRSKNGGEREVMEVGHPWGATW